MVISLLKPTDTDNPKSFSYTPEQDMPDSTLPSYTPEHIAEEPAPPSALPSCTPQHLMTEEESIERMKTSQSTSVRVINAPQVEAQTTSVPRVDVQVTSAEVEYARDIAHSLIAYEKLKSFFLGAPEKIRDALFTNTPSQGYSFTLNNGYISVVFRNGGTVEPARINNLLKVMQAIEDEVRPFELLKLCEKVEFVGDKFIWFTSLRNFLSKIIAGSATLTDFDFQAVDGVYWQAEFYAYVLPKLVTIVSRAANNGEIPPLSDELREQICSYATLMYNGRPPSKTSKFPVASLLNGCMGTALSAGAVAFMTMTSVGLGLIFGLVGSAIYSLISWNFFAAKLSFRNKTLQMKNDILKLTTGGDNSK